MTTTTSLVTPNSIHELQAVFAQLPAKLQEWLLLRRYHDSDKACSTALTGKGDWHRNHKSLNRDFRRCYDLLLSLDTTEVDQALIESLATSNALKALIEERKILEMDWSDARQGLATVKGQAMKSAVERVKGAHSTSTTEHIYRVEEVVKLIETSGVVVEDGG